MKKQDKRFKPAKVVFKSSDLPNEERQRILWEVLEFLLQEGIKAERKKDRKPGIEPEE